MAAPRRRAIPADRTACKGRLSWRYHGFFQGSAIMTEPVLHHYPVSPFAEKARLMLGFTPLAGRSVPLPLILPKPAVVAFTAGSRRTPILQVGAAIYCDTALIARTL